MYETAWWRWPTLIGQALLAALALFYLFRTRVRIAGARDLDELTSEGAMA